ncbi:unnamed protein product, partial [Mesorhabditis belari]|uniref:Lysophospholipid acyltransferase 5 n=1 Tax=Mesorhabditis belari TaxID=2138241 RepID=A0AAF3F8J7_9BILA
MVADGVGAREDGVRLLLTVLAGYPLSAAHRCFFYKKDPQIQHAFFVACGIVLYFFNYGFTIYHSLISILFAYVITNFLRGKNEAVWAAHIAFLGHLLVGYWFAETDTYDITWTTPFCIMCLRFIGLVMDVYDGQHYDSLKADQKLTAIRDPPSLLETAAFGLFFTGTLVGPQFSLARFRAFVNGDFLDEQKQVRSSGLMPSLGRFVAGVFYMVINQWGAVWIPDSYFNSEAYFNASFFWRWTWAVIWFRLTMYRYCAAWLLSEGGAILNGIAYNGKDEKGEDKWDGVRDIHISRWEFGHDYNSVVLSFNCGTNTFAKNHIFRRLRWLNSKPLAHLSVLMYLAVWHGYHLGYFLLFIFEFSCMIAQEQLYFLIDRVPGWKEFNQQTWMRPICWLTGKMIISYSMGFAFLTFGLIKTRLWYKPLFSLYGIGYILYFVAWPILFQVLKRKLPLKKSEKVEKKTE